MRLSETKVDYLCRRIYQALKESKHCALLRTEAPVVAATKRIFLDDLIAEDQMDDEVRQILEEHSEEIRRKGADYHTMFRKTKSLLARERKMVF